MQSDGKKLIQSILLWTVIFTGIVMGYTSLYLEKIKTISLLIGSLWNVINFYLISCLIPLVIRPLDEKIDKIKLSIISVGFVFLLGMGAGIVKWGLLEKKINPMALLCGFSILFVVLMLKCFGKLFRFNKKEE